MNALLRPALACVLALFLSGCGSHWLVGKWTVDRETTLANLAPRPGDAENPGEAFLKELAAGLQKGVSRLLLASFEGVEIEFTATEMRRMRNGSGEVTAYEIIERPSSGVVVLKFADGDIVTWARAGTGIRMRLPGEQEQWVYFMPAK